jgi:hypothetical protein
MQALQLIALQRYNSTALHCCGYAALWGQQLVCACSLAESQTGQQVILISHIWVEKARLTMFVVKPLASEGGKIVVDALIHIFLGEKAILEHETRPGPTASFYASNP